MTEQAPKLVIFEQPLNEYIRVCLRLEKLFHQLNEHLRDPGLSHSRGALFAILKILEIINRPDLKTKLTQALTQHACTLGQLEHLPQVNKERLHNVLKNLDSYIAKMHNNHRKIAERLLNNEFLNQMRLQMSSPGGINDEKVPAYKLWLSQPSAKRVQDLVTWGQEFEEISNIVDILLQLMRDSTPAQHITAKNGFHHQTLDGSPSCELIRVMLPAGSGVYPEVSADKRRLNVRFLIPNFHEDGKAVQTREDIHFQLSCCRF